MQSPRNANSTSKRLSFQALSLKPRVFEQILSIQLLSRSRRTTLLEAIKTYKSYQGSVTSTIALLETTLVLLGPLPLCLKEARINRRPVISTRNREHYSNRHSQSYQGHSKGPPYSNTTTLSQPFVQRLTPWTQRLEVSFLNYRRTLANGILLPSFLGNSKGLRFTTLPLTKS